VFASRRVSKRLEEDNNKIRAKLGIDIVGEDVPPPITSFTAMRLPRAILKRLKREKIVTPAPIQVQGLPVLLSGRDCVGISYTGSGKTLVFALPMILLALQVWHGCLARWAMTA
jgi:ATP-dependent RNA helicase DDX41